MPGDFVVLTEITNINATVGIHSNLSFCKMSLCHSILIPNKIVNVEKQNMAFFPRFRLNTCIYFLLFAYTSRFRKRVHQNICKEVTDSPPKMVWISKKHLNAGMEDLLRCLGALETQVLVLFFVQPVLCCVGRVFLMEKRQPVGWCMLLSGLTSRGNASLSAWWGGWGVGEVWHQEIEPKCQGFLGDLPAPKVVLWKCTESIINCNRKKKVYLLEFGRGNKSKAMVSFSPLTRKKNV